MVIVFITTEFAFLCNMAPSKSLDQKIAYNIIGTISTGAMACIYCQITRACAHVAILYICETSSIGVTLPGWNKKASK